MRLRWIGWIAVVGSAGCSFLLQESGSTDDPDAATDANDTGAPDAATANTDDFTRPYTCDDDTVALYHFDDDDEPGADACAKEIDLTAANATVTEHNGFDLAADIVGAEAVHSSAPTGRITFYKALTVEAWVRPPTDPTEGEEFYIVTSQDLGDQNGARRFRFLLTVDSGVIALRFEVADASCGTFSIAQFGSLAGGQWHHVAAVADATSPVVTTMLYIDGAASIPVGGQPELCEEGAESIIMVGGKPRSENPQMGNIDGEFGMAIDEVRISDAVRTFVTL